MKTKTWTQIHLEYTSSGLNGCICYASQTFSNFWKTIDGKQEIRAKAATYLKKYPSSIAGLCNPSSPYLFTPLQDNNFEYQKIRKDFLDYCAGKK